MPSGQGDGLQQLMFFTSSVKEKKPSADDNIIFFKVSISEAWE